MSKECKACGFPSSDKSCECEFCGVRFDNIVSGVNPKISLINNICNCVVEIPEDGCIISRGSEIAPEIFNHKWVSEPHCRILLKDHECYIEDVGSQGNGSTNGTFLDGIKLAPRIPTKFYNGSRINIAHLIFDAKVEYPQTQPSTSGCCDSVEEKLIWVIVCKGCGKRYEVENASKRLKDCACCRDSIDREILAKIKPRQVKAE